MTELPRGIIPAAVTPFRDGKLDREAFAFNIERWNLTGLAGYLVLGSNGEGIFLDDEEVPLVIETAAEKRSPGKFLLAGTGRESTRRTIDLTRRAARAGAEAVLVVPPSYYRASMTDSALEHHYRAVADASEVPVLLYHVPKFSPVNFSLKLILSLAAHPNIAGLKETSGDLPLLSAVIRDRPPSFRVYVGAGSLLLAGLVLGSDGGILALANAAPAECVEMARCVEAGDIARAREIQMRLLALNQAVTATHGVAGLKHAMNLLGYRAGTTLRPLEPLTPGAAEDVAEVVRKSGVRGP